MKTKPVLLILACVLAAGCVGAPGANQRAAYVAAHPELTAQQQADIRAGMIRVGMCDAHVLAAWGKPTRINRTTTAYGTREQWIYQPIARGGGGRTKYVYIENGIVTAAQD